MKKGMPWGYVGKILRVDLTSGHFADENLPGDDILRRYVGGVGLALKILCDEVPPSIGPLEPDNRLVFMTGPLTGTPVPSGNNCCVASVNADTGTTFGAAHTHGLFGAFLKFAGYDGIIIQGSAREPVFLSVIDAEVRIKDARRIWGRDTHDTEDLVKEELREPRASVACIGPAGENRIGGAAVTNDKYHLAAFCGMGAVMGSKNLKAIAVFGRGGVRVSRPKELLDIAASWRHKAAPTRPPAQMTREWIQLAQASILACKNLSTADFAVKVAQRFVNACKEFKITPKPCFGCPTGCAYKAVVTSGPYKGYIATMSGGGENLEGAAAMVGVTDPGSILWLTDRYDRLGLCVSTVGCAISLAFECYEKGLLTKKDTNGLELTWGNTEAASKLLDLVVAREGLGAILAEGPQKAAERIGGDAAKYAVHIKGVGPRIHDWRGRWQSMLAQAVSGAGPRGEGMRFELGKPSFEAEGLAQAVRQAQMRKLFEDSIGVCTFMCSRIPEILGIETAAISAATGWDGFTPQEALCIGERIANLQRVFNLSRGLTTADDMDVSPRMLEPPPDGVARGQSIAPYLADLIHQYYQLMGWDESTGEPRAGTLARLGLDHL